MTKELQITEVNKDLIIKYMDAFGISGKLQDNEKKQFCEIAQAYQLNPFKREIYCIPYNTKDGRKLSVITGYEIYLKRAERSGKLDGWRVWTEGDIKDGSLKSCIEISRKDWGKPLTHEVLFREYSQPYGMWKQKPYTMIKKVAIAQGFRLAFPDELGGIPYTSDELPENMTKESPPPKDGEKPPEVNRSSNTPAQIEAAPPPDQSVRPQKTLCEAFGDIHPEMKSYLPSLESYYKDKATLKDILIKCERLLLKGGKPDEVYLELFPKDAIPF